MPTICANFVTINFPSPESKSAFKEKIEDPVLHQENVIRKARHIFLLTELGRCTTSQTTDPSLPAYDAAKSLEKDYFKTRKHELPAFSLFKALLQQNPAIDEQVSQTIDAIYTDMEASKHTYDTLNNEEKELVSEAFTQRLGDSDEDDYVTAQSWYEGLMTPMRRLVGGAFDFNKFVGFNLTDHLRGGNPFRQLTDKQRIANPYGGTSNPTEPWSELVSTEDNQSVQFKMYTANSPALPVFRAIFAEFEADGSVISLNEDDGTAIIEKFENGSSVSYSQDEIDFGDIEPIEIASKSFTPAQEVVESVR